MSFGIEYGDDIVSCCQKFWKTKFVRKKSGSRAFLKAARVVSKLSKMFLE